MTNKTKTKKNTLPKERVLTKEDFLKALKKATRPLYVVKGYLPILFPAI
jgi:hypothetical protein